MTTIQHLDMSNNELRAVPLALGNLRALKLLALDSNKILTLPDTIPCLKSLVMISGDKWGGVARMSCMRLERRVGRVARMSCMRLERRVG